MPGCGVGGGGGWGWRNRVESGGVLGVGGFSVAEDRVVFEGRKFSLVKRAVRDRDGAEREYDLVVHPGAAVILPVLDDGRIVMIRNYRFAVDATLLELPAGTLEPPEPAIECARRELIEETGYRAERIEPLMTFYSTPGMSTECMYVFVARGLTAGAAAREAGEEIENEVISLADALEGVRSGEIRDGKSVAALLYYERHGQDGN